MTSDLDHNRSGQIFASAVFVVAAICLGIYCAEPVARFIITHFFSFNPAKD